MKSIVVGARCWTGKLHVFSFHGNNFVSLYSILKTSQNPIITGMSELIRPLIIRLLNYIKFNPKNIKVNRTRVYKRDNYECVYCGSKKQLTLDHVIPKSRGGANTWENLVTSCFKCNLKKADRTPEEARMVMSQKPFAPTIANENVTLSKIWNDFQKSFVY